MKLDKRFPVEQFEATVSQSAAPSPPPLRNAEGAGSLGPGCALTLHCRSKLVRLEGEAVEPRALLPGETLVAAGRPTAGPDGRAVVQVEPAGAVPLDAVLARCPYRGCPHEVPPELLGRHTEICAHRQMRCEYLGCGARCTRGSLDRHMASCGHRPVSCSYPGCARRVNYYYWY